MHIWDLANVLLAFSGPSRMLDVCHQHSQAHSCSDSLCYNIKFSLAARSLRLAENDSSAPFTGHIFPMMTPSSGDVLRYQTSHTAKRRSGKKFAVREQVSQELNLGLAAGKTVAAAHVTTTPPTLFCGTLLCGGSGGLTLCADEIATCGVCQPLVFSGPESPDIYPTSKHRESEVGNFYKSFFGCRRLSGRSSIPEKKDMGASECARVERNQAGWGAALHQIQTEKVGETKCQQKNT
ncbi:hypothetical protein IWZ00DRAFT_293396 [Phyllosticta capitalensis]|uniref:Uncharacterized protein n=1 Tax=Phyllosticta capitalensis TaxID=121624 RepID=A0ABR1YR17_9PEZI